MQRRSILSLIGGAALAATTPLLAQQPKPARIGVLVLANWERPVAQIKDGLRELGYVEGKNLVIEIRSAQGKPEALDALAAELVGLRVDVIVTVLTPSVFAAKRATSTIPVVMAGAGDPVGTGLVASLALVRANALALQHRLPSYSVVRSFVDSGGLLTYAASDKERYQRTAWYIDKILKGANPADLPVEQPTRFELVINGKTAKALGITIPQTVLLRATEVIE